MILKVKLFALARQLADAEAIEVSLADGSTVADLRRGIASQFPTLADLASHAAFAVNSQYATEETVLSGDAEIACIPPVSGG